MEQQIRCRIKLVPLLVFVAPRTPRATIEVDSLEGSSIVWNVGEGRSDDDEDCDLSQTSERIEFPSSPSYPSGAARLSTGGKAIHPATHRSDRLRLLLLRRLLKVRVKNSVK